MKLGHDQRRALDACMGGRNVFISGPGGVGKSTVVAEIIEALKFSGRAVKVCASTGVAAVNVGGETVHRFLGTQIIGSVRELKREIAGGSILRWAKPGRIREADTLIVDEISMLTGDFVDMMDEWMRQVRGRAEPFGGVQIIFVGDFFQLPPVIRDGSQVERQYAFEADAWTDADLEVVELEENFRQDDARLIGMLGAIRRGDASDAVLAYFNARVGAEVLNPTKLCPTNREAHAVNLRRLSALSGEMHTYEADVTGFGLSEGARERARATLIKNCIAEEVLNLKVGCPVLFLRNDYNWGFHNGEPGVVEECYENSILVEHVDGRTIPLEPAAWVGKSAEGNIESELRQIPVKPAFALTIHKAQGMTLDSLQITTSGSFAAGQTYVALSRMRRIEGLKLTDPIRAAHVIASDRVLEFYRGLGVEA